ncbi:glutathione S-transferase family protein [Sphingomonas sp.]|uniref:glutathione S-transferase family protein n=1 Tax=Sphingomonas sp. TaxID=28214 RepID=UPI002B9691E0|nr:glutathione S-transferase family protein [Sphingomonas sp.]HWK35686.1 glutathione S-transferase family protein [Sphingomonas sp.]
MTEATIKLYAHPLSSYCHKALVAFYENAIPFDYGVIDGSEPVTSTFARLSPMGKFPILVEGDRTIFEATAIIEYLHVRHPGDVRLIPDDPDQAVEVRMLDRFFDNYVMTPQGKVVIDHLRDSEHDLRGVREARAMLDRAYAWLDERMAEREWAAAEQFSLADCAAAPALLYADWTHPIPERFENLRAYRARLLARPSYARALDEARPYRHMFPLGAPADRD